MVRSQASKKSQPHNEVNEAKPQPPRKKNKFVEQKVTKVTKQESKSTGNQASQKYDQMESLKSLFYVPSKTIGRMAKGECSDESGDFDEPTLSAPTPIPIKSMTTKTTPQSKFHQNIKKDGPVSKWSQLVERTKQSIRYDNGLASKAEEEKWTISREHGGWCNSQSHTIVITYETCVTQNPQTNEENPKTLVRIGILNGESISEVLLDTLIKPEFPIIGMDTEAHGIILDHIKISQFSTRHAVTALSMFCCANAVIIGYDLATFFTSVRFYHDNFVDLSLIYDLANEPFQTPNLEDICKNVLNKEYPSRMNVSQKAKLIYNIVETGLERGINYAIRKRDGHNVEKRLFASNIPESITKEDLIEIIKERTFICPRVIGDFKTSANLKTCTIQFASQEHAELAFNSLPGQTTFDKSTRQQKKIRLFIGQEETFFLVRKMAS